MKKQLMSIIYDFRKRTLLLCLSTLLIGVSIHILDMKITTISNYHTWSLTLLSGLIILLYGMSFFIILMNYIFYKYKHERVSKRVVNCNKILGCILLFSIYILVVSLQLFYLDVEMFELSVFRRTDVVCVKLTLLVWYVAFGYILYYMAMILKNIVNCPDIKLFDSYSNNDFNHGDLEYVTDLKKIKKYSLRTLVIITTIVSGYAIYSVRDEGDIDLNIDRFLEVTFIGEDGNGKIKIEYSKLNSSQNFNSTFGYPKSENYQLINRFITSMTCEVYDVYNNKINGHIRNGEAIKVVLSYNQEYADALKVTIENESDSKFTLQDNTIIYLCVVSELI